MLSPGQSSSGFRGRRRPIPIRRVVNELCRSEDSKRGSCGGGQVQLSGRRNYLVNNVCASWIPFVFRDYLGLFQKRFDCPESKCHSSLGQQHLPIKEYLHAPSTTHPTPEAVSHSSSFRTVPIRESCSSPTSAPVVVENPCREIGHRY